jgi:transporter family-2 protein
MNAFVFLMLLALLAGIVIPTQAGINAQLSLWTKSSVLSSTVSFAVGTLVLIIYSAVMRIPLPAMATAGVHPWWVWTGGALGAYFVAATIFLAPKLGATTMVALLLAGQMVASLAFDHFGLLGYPIHPISLGRIAGVIMIAGGVMLVKNF